MMGSYRMGRGPGHVADQTGSSYNVTGQPPPPRTVELGGAHEEEFPKQGSRWRWRRWFCPDAERSLIVLSHNACTAPDKALPEVPSRDSEGPAPRST